ncbi:MAG: hypothetical protein WC029_10700 [Sulfuricella sp.]|jgi:hypothetical protein
MQKLTAQDPEAQFAGLIAENIAKLKALLPELLTEDASGVEINAAVLSQLVGKVATDSDEKYALNRSTEHGDSAALIEFMLQMILDATPRAQSKAQNGAQSEAILHALMAAPLPANELIAHLGLRSKTGAFKRAMKTLLNDGLIEYTIPDKPNSRLQKYRLTGKAQKEI